MDNSWQIKCSSAWQSTPSLPSSSQLPPHGSRNQMDMKAGHYLQPYIAQELSSTDRGVIQQPMVFNTLNLDSCKSSKLEMGNSFLALLSGPSSQLQCDFQQLSNSKPSMAAGKFPIHDMVSGGGSGISITSTGSLSQRQCNNSIKNGVELCPVVPSRVVPSSSCSCVSVLHDNLNTASLNFQNLDLTKTVVHHTGRGNETGMDKSSLRWGWHASSKPSDAGQLLTTNIQALPKMTSVARSVVSNQSSLFTGECPRVFCQGTSGNLLLSNTGLLGVVCLCHGLHMSISKFCEHSGLCAVNPGYAVHLSNGETVAQWRRLYFHKLRIRVLDDHSGWDWPEGFSAAGALVKCKATVPNMSNSSDMFQLVDSFGGIARSEQPCNDFVFPKNHHTGHSVFEKSVNKVMNNAQQMNAQEGHNVLLKSLIGNPCNNLPALAKSKIMECPMSGGLATSKSVLDKGRQDGGYQSICDYIELITKGGNPFISNSSLGSVKALGTDSDVSRFNSSKEAFIVDTDAMASNIELRLGQPSQQSRTLGGSVLSALGPRVFDALDDAQKSLSQEHLIHNTVNPRVIEESRQNLQCAPSDTSSPNRKEKQIRLNLMHHALGANNAINTAKLEQFRGDMGKSLPISMFSSHVGTPTVGSIQSQATNNIFNGSEHFMPRILHGESHIAKCDPIDFPWNRSDGTERQLNINGPGLYNYLGKGKGARCDSDGTYVAAKSDFAFHNKMGDSSSFNGFIGGRCLPIGSAVHEKQSDYFSQLSGMPSDASNGSNPFNQSGKNSCVGSSGRLGHGFLSSVSSFPVTAGPVLPLPAVSMGLSSATSISRPNLTPTFSNKEGSDLRPHLLDENLRFLALKHISELSKREHAITSFEMNPEQGRLNSSSDKEMRTKGFVENPLASEEPMQGSYLPIKKDASEIAIESLQSCSTCCKGGIEKLAAVAGLNWCNLSASTQGILLHSKECDIQCPPYHDPLMDKHPSRRLGRNENNTTASGEHDKCCQKEQNTCFPGKCSCAVHSKCLARSYISIGEPSLDACKGDVGSVDGKDSMLVASIFDKGHIIPGDKAITIDQFKKLRGLIPMKTDYRAAQWRDVPTKVMGVHSATCIKRPAKVLNTKGNVDDQLADTAAKRLNGTPQEAESFKEQQMSNACSGFSAPAVTEVSVEVNNMDSCTIDTGDTRYVNDLVVDEGSGIEKCWSSDDALDSERSAEFLGVTGKIDSTKEASSSALPYQSSRDLSDEVKLRNSFKLKKVRNQLHAGCTVHEKINHTQQFERDLKAGRRKRALKWKRLDASVPASGLSSVRYESFKSTGNTELHSHASKEAQIPCRPVQEMPQTCAIYSAGPSSLKRKWSVLSSAKTLSRKRDLHRLDNHNREWENDYQTQSDDDVNCLKLPKLSRENKLKRHWTADLSKQFLRQEMNHADGDKAAKYKPVGCHKNLSRHQVNICDKKTRPVVRGKLGIISNGKLPEDIEKPAKIVSLRTILKTAKRCTISESEEPKLTSTLETKKTTFRRSGGCYNELSISKKGRGNDGNAINNETEPCTSMIGTKEACFSGDKVCVYELSMLEKERDEGCRNFSMLQGFSSARLKPRFKEARKRSLFELTVKGKNPSSAKVSLTKISKCALQAKCRYKGKSYLKDTEDSKCHRNGLYQVNAQKSIKEHKCQGFISDSDAFCCVCGSSNKDEINFLLECGQCLIRVHQACYGISKVPKGRWCCRPCRTNSRDIVCVLCGYEGGAMTRAVRSRNIVKGLLKAWNILTESKSKKSIPFSETLPDELNVVGASRFGHEADSISLLRPVNIEQSPSAVWELDLQYQMDVVTNSNGSPCNLQVCNSVTAGVLDSTVTQWVHMVCGLWTPGTRCPNVDTMSAFDVSGASRPGENVICSMCNRPGGSCINCRAVNCSVYFHPWCAHQKGLLQSEVEGVDNENVGFYGRCVIHATHDQCDSGSHPIESKVDCSGEKGLTCARTEGYKGRKREGFRYNLHGQANDNSRCLVPQDQINAWLHINGQKSCSTRGLPKLPASDVEYDCRKEYAHYKQAKGWKHLVVYKSGIHALGLYTSRFISRGAMVVEYVGEIVGLRVADKRENEYQTGRLQYKSACYFFRIDKEHIIDATRKGGIARFVNHSCLPNCVAKVICVRNEKKVVFFAERDINPGEEITYDYHFNHEDEGKKIPCFCNSKNCRRYLN